MSWVRQTALAMRATPHQNLAWSLRRREQMKRKAPMRLRYRLAMRVLFATAMLTHARMLVGSLQVTSQCSRRCVALCRSMLTCCFDITQSSRLAASTANIRVSTEKPMLHTTSDINAFALPNQTDHTREHATDKQRTQTRTHTHAGELANAAGRGGVATRPLGLAESPLGHTLPATLVRARASGKTAPPDLSPATQGGAH